MKQKTNKLSHRHASQKQALLDSLSSTIGQSNQEIVNQTQVISCLANELDESKTNETCMDQKFKDDIQISSSKYEIIVQSLKSDYHRQSIILKRIEREKEAAVCQVDTYRSNLTKLHSLALRYKARFEEMSQKDTWNRRLKD